MAAGSHATQDQANAQAHLHKVTHSKGARGLDDACLDLECAQVRKRTGSVYLAYVLEPGQGTMTKQLTALTKEVLRRWERPLPHLSY